MHRPIFGHSFAVLVAPVLLSVLGFNFLNKKRTRACGNAEDVDTDASGSMAAPTESNSDGSSPSPTKANNGASSSMAAPTETNSDGSSLSLTKANNGASSSLTENCYEVFLSFRGPDTRHGFTDHLYKGLIDAGIDAFRDDDELCHGEDIRPVLKEAITSSKILIPIFSVNYGTSSWCLNELVQMMELKKKKGQILLPIFYKVKPAEVRYQKGRFGEAFHERESRLLERSSFDPMTLVKWKSALDEVSTLKGYEANGSEVELVKSIVQKVLNELKKKFELVITENLIGIDGHMKKVMKFMKYKSHATLFFGIYGMGGIGKTTLAKAIYNELSSQFEHRSFIADIRESWKRNGVHYLQNQLIKDILNRENEVSNEDEGTKFISSKFKGKKVLVLLDDVDNVIQLKHLAGAREWFSLGSRIIITTRNKGVLEEARVDHNYEHAVLDDNQSLILFSKNAFRMDSPPKEFKDLTREVVSITKGLPLSLEVLGSLLCGKKKAFWEGTIVKLRTVPPMEVQKKLRISIEALDYKQKQIFLDIACFFINFDKEITSYMWDACDFFPDEGIEVLIFMSLIKVDNDNGLKMHDQLRDLGREIAREEYQEEPWRRSRLWDHEVAQKVLKENKGTDNIKAINLSESSSEYLNEIYGLDGDDQDGLNEIYGLNGDDQDGGIYTGKQFENLTNLKFLYMKKTHLIGDFKNSMKRLKWLEWEKCPASFEAKNFHVEELVALGLQEGKINEKWGGWSFFKMAERLKYLNLSRCTFLEDTDFLSAFKKLEVLILNSCWELKRIDASIEDMKGLLRLELYDCKSLTELPAEIGNLKALRLLSLMMNSSLSALPNSIGCLENLEILYINHSGIEELPEGIGRLRKLQELYASNCNNMREIMVESMCNLSSLQHLDFLHSHNLQSLPGFPSGLTYLGVTCQSHKLPSLSHLPHLKELQVKDCEFLECIQVLPSTPLKNSKCSQLTDVEELESPRSLNTPFKLELLDVRKCHSLKTLDISQFIHLRTLSICDCGNLPEVRGLDKLICLESLTIMMCRSIKQLDLPNFEGMKKLVVEQCEKLAEIQGLDKSEDLESLHISQCTSIERLDLPKSGRLKKLDIADCKSLAEIRGLGSSKCLESLIICCTSIGRLLLPKSGRLKELKVEACENLAEILSLDRSEFLESLDISECTSIGRLLLPESGRLKELKAEACKNLAEILSLVRSENLVSLDISKCTSIGRLLLPKFGRLKQLKAEACKNLAEILSLDKSEFLETLNISNCTSIGRLLLPKSGMLKELKARACKNLVEILSLDRLEFLETLNISNCTSIRRLLLPKSGRLKELKAINCFKLAEIQDLDSLKFLERLCIYNCTSIKTLLLPKTKSLYELRVGGCFNLAEIQDLYSLEFLERLDISYCTSIKGLDLPKSGSLKKLYVKSCEKLAKIQGLDGLECLERLDISGCISIKRLLLPKSESLKILKIEDCENLVEIQGLDRLQFLEKLNIFGYNSLKAIPKLSRTQIYQRDEIIDGEMTKSGSDYMSDLDGEMTESGLDYMSDSDGEMTEFGSDYMSDSDGEMTESGLDFMIDSDESI